MTLDATEEARRDLAELRARIDDCRRELGISKSEPIHQSTKRSPGIFRRGLRGSRQARRQAPVA
jgi:hypothetical protein